MHVVFIGLNYWPEQTGIAPYTTSLASGLAEKGWGVRVVTGYPHYPMWRVSGKYRGLKMTEVIAGVALTRLRPFVPSRPTGLKRLLMEISFGLSTLFTSWGKPDVVVLVSPALFAVALAQLRARFLPGRPAVVVWVQDIYTCGVTETGVMGTKGANLVAKIESAVLNRADLVVVIHDRFKRFLVSSLGVGASNIEVVRNWTHMSPTLGLENRDRMRAQFGWGDETVVLHAGNMGAKQALENVIDSARLADAAGARIRFVLLGNGNQRDNLKGLAQDVIRLDFMDSLDEADFKGVLAAADVLLVNEKAGVTEMAVPSKLTSYFASTRPVLVASGEGSITAEELADANAGVRVDAGDPESLLKEALALGNDPKRAEFLGQNGAEFQARVLSEDTAISRFTEILTALALRGRQAPAVRDLQGIS